MRRADYNALKALYHTLMTDPEYSEGSPAPAVEALGRLLQAGVRNGIGIDLSLMEVPVKVGEEDSGVAVFRLVRHDEDGALEVMTTGPFGGGLAIEPSTGNVVTLSSNRVPRASGRR